MSSCLVRGMQAAHSRLHRVPPPKATISRVGEQRMCVVQCIMFRMLAAGISSNNAGASLREYLETNLRNICFVHKDTSPKSTG